MFLLKINLSMQLPKIVDKTFDRLELSLNVAEFDINRVHDRRRRLWIARTELDRLPSHRRFGQKIFEEFQMRFHFARQTLILNEFEMNGICV
jgi:hypothetical protein